MIVRRLAMPRLIVLSTLAAAVGCGGGSGGAPMTIDADRYELPADAAPPEDPAAGSGAGRGDIYNPKDDLFPPE